MTLNTPENSKAVSGAHLASVGKEEETRHVDALDLKGTWRNHRPSYRPLQSTPAQKSDEFRRVPWKHSLRLESECVGFVEGMLEGVEEAETAKGLSKAVVWSKVSAWPVELCTPVTS